MQKYFIEITLLISGPPLIDVKKKPINTKLKKCLNLCRVKTNQTHWGADFDINVHNFLHVLSAYPYIAEHLLECRTKVVLHKEEKKI